MSPIKRFPVFIRSLLPTLGRLALLLLVLNTAKIALPSAIAESPAPIRVTVTIPPQAFIVESIGAEDVTVQVLLPPGVNHESYEPSLKQLSSLLGTEILFTVGHPHFAFEQVWVPKVKELSKQTVVINTTSHARSIDDDMHIWLSFDGLNSMIEVISQSLSDRLPAKRSEFEGRAQLLKTQLSSAKDKLTNQLKASPQKPFLSFHPAYTYLAAELNLRQLVIEHCGKESGIATASHVIEQAKAAGVRTLIVEPNTSKQQGEFIASRLKASITVLDPLAKDPFQTITDFGNALSKTN